MAANAAWSDLNTHRSGTSWDGLSFIPRDADKVPLDLTGATVRFVLFDACRAKLVEWTLGAGITYELEDPEDVQSPLVLKIHGPNVVTIPGGKHHYFLEITLLDGRVLVVLEGGWLIVESIP